MPIVKRRDVINFTKHYWSEKRLMGVLAVVFMGISVGVDVLYPVMSGRLVDKLTELDPKAEGSLHQVFLAFAALMAIQLSHTWFWTAALWCWNKFAVHNMYRLLTDALYKVQRFSTDWHVNAFAGATVRKITRGMWSFDVFEDTIFMGFFPASIIGIGMTVMLIIQVPIVGWFALPMVALFVGASIYLALKVNMPRFKRSAASDTEVGATIADIMTAIPTVKSFAGENREDTHFAKVATKWKNLSLHAWLTAMWVDLGRSHIRIVLMIGMISLTIMMWYRGEATPGDVTLAITSFFIIGGYLRDIGRQTTELLRSVSEMEDVISFWIREDDIQDAPDAKTLSIEHGKGKTSGATITFDTVGFAYKSDDRKIYDGLSVEIKAGEKVALVGASGSGKSTFVKLVQRLYDIQSGAVLIDGQNIAQVTQQSLRKNIALVPQEPVLFHRSLADNIAYGRPDATLDEIRQAAHEAFAADFIERLPLGYNTLVGERGIKLSGGERQRVAIARALLADCPILILDEATSSLDSVSEHYIQKALDKLMEGRTTITIAHRLATIQKADRILVFADGRIIEQGTHKDLLQNPSSTYRRLYEMQALDLVGE
jgi:ATP-binding cassette subfamily B protein